MALDVGAFSSSCIKELLSYSNSSQRCSRYPNSLVISCSILWSSHNKEASHSVFGHRCATVQSAHFGVPCADLLWIHRADILIYPQIQLVRSAGIEIVSSTAEYAHV